jgi:hypothetical protein
MFLQEVNLHLESAFGSAHAHLSATVAQADPSYHVIRVRACISLMTSPGLPMV